MVNSGSSANLLTMQCLINPYRKKRLKKGDEVFWIIVTEPHKGIGFNKDKLEEHKNLIKEISKQYNFKKTIELNFPAAELDTIPKKNIVKTTK